MIRLVVALPGEGTKASATVMLVAMPTLMFPILMVGYYWLPKIAVKCGKSARAELMQARELAAK